MNSEKLSEEKNIALIAHDARKQDLLEWVSHNKDTLSNHRLFGTGTTGKLVADHTGLTVHQYRSGPLGGDQQIGSRIAEGEIDFMIFFWDPLESQPHDPDVKALLRMSVLYNIPTACNRATADFLISSPFFEGEYQRIIPDFSRQLEREHFD